MDDLKNSRGIQSVDYTADILELFSKNSTSYTLKEIASEMGASSAKVYPYLVSLVRTGLLSKSDSSSYQIGQLTVNLAFKALNYLDPLEETSKILKEISSQTSHLATLSTWGSFGPTIIRTFESNSNLYAKVRVGSVMSIINTTTGLTFAKNLPEHIVKEALQFDEFRYAGSKLSTNEKKDFLNSLQNLDSNDLFTVVLDKPINGISSISVPIFSLSNELLFVITVFNNTNIITPNLDELKDIITQKLLKLSRTLGTS